MAQSKQDELYKALQQKGYPDSLCREIACCLAKADEI